MCIEIKRVIKNNELAKETWIIGKFTIVRLTTPYGTIGVGISRRTEEDKPSKLGYTIAYGRALKAIVKKLNKEKINHILMG